MQTAYKGRRLRRAVYACAATFLALFCVHRIFHLLAPAARSHGEGVALPPPASHASSEADASNDPATTWATDMLLKQTEPLTLSEMSGMWQNITSSYCAELSAQTASETFVNLADSNVEWMSLQNGEEFSDENVEIVRLLLRTRRFNHALALVLGQDEAGRKRMADTIASGIGTLREMFQRVNAQWGSLQDIHKPETQERVRAFKYGDIAAPQFTAERYGTDGTTLGLAANACLLGLCGEAGHLGVLMSVAQPGDPMIGYGARFAAIDAMDRIIMRQKSNTSLAPEAQAVVAEYTDWRDRRKLCARTGYRTFAYDAPGTPYDLPGTVGGLPRRVLPDFELPYVPACYGERMRFKSDTLDSQETLQEYNDEVMKMGAPEWTLHEDPARGLTIDDTHYIMKQSQRLAEMTARK